MDAALDRSPKPPKTEGKALAERLKAGNTLLLAALGPPAEATNGPREKTVGLAVAENGVRLVVSFAGNTRRFVLPDALKSYPDTHILTLRDPARCFALLGIPHLGGDYRSTVDAILGIAAELGSPPIYCVGASAGGYPALRYGLDLGAQGVLGLSAPTTLDIDNDPAGSTAKYPQLALLYRRARHLAIDLVPEYRERRPRPRVILVYTASHERDAWLSERMSNQEGIELIQAPDQAGHKTLMYLDEAGELETYLHRLFALEPLR